MDIALALAAAVLFAVGTVLQQRAAMREPSDRGSAGLLLRLARRPVWLGGIAADGLGFLGQAAALGTGRLAVVQPLLATSVVFSLPLGARLTGQRVGRRDVLAAVAVTAGLAGFLLFGDASGGRDDAPLAEWAVAGAVLAGLSAVMMVAARRLSPAPRAALLGTATGLLFGLSAALTKATVDRLDDGAVALFADWHLWALLAVGYASMTLSQLSLQTGALAAAMATSMALDPLTSVVLGTTLLHESLDVSGAALAGSLVALAVMLAGIVALAAAQPAGEEPAHTAPAAPAAAHRASVAGGRQP